MTTVQLNDTLLQLDGLYTAYSELLESAKKQLENLEVDDATAGKIAEHVSKSDGMTALIREYCFNQLMSNLQSPDSDAFEGWRGSRFMEMIADRCNAEARNLVNQGIQNHLQSAEVSRLIDRRMKEAIDNHTSVSDSMSVHMLAKALFKQLNNSTES